MPSCAVVSVVCLLMQGRNQNNEHYLMNKNYSAWSLQCAQLHSGTRSTLPLAIGTAGLNCLPEDERLC